MTYDSYEAAKIAMPQACICVYKNDGKDVFTGMPSREGTTLFNGAEFAEPKDYCMTVENFLADGHKFVEGDLIIGFGDELCTVCMVSVTAWNDGESDDSDSKRHVLSAAALETKEPKRTKTEYVKVDCKSIDFWEVAKEYQSKMHTFWKQDNGSKVVQDLEQLVEQYKKGEIYRRIETEMDERQEFINVACSTLDDDESLNHYSKYFGQLYDSGKFKLVESE